MGKDLSTLSNYTTSIVARYGQLYYVAPEQRDKLKDATERSDIYSLGKLLNFILTGRDPDVIHASEFNSVIEKATQYEPGARYQSILEFEKAYNRLKSLLLPEETSTLPRTLVDFNNSSKLDWNGFHRLAAHGEHDGHPYSDYVNPVVDLLSRSANLRDYYEEVGDSFADLLKMFIAKLGELAGMTGWPFSETSSFGKFLRDVFFTVREPALKLLSLKELWNIAYEQDQWGVQSIIGGLLSGDNIPEEIQTPFAVHILDSSVESLPDYSSARIPRILKQALINKGVEIASNQKRRQLHRVLTELNEDELELLKLFASGPSSDLNQFEHPLLRHSVYRSSANGVLTKEANGELGEHKERISLIPEAVELIEELVVKGKVQRDSIILDYRNIASSGAGGSGAPVNTNPSTHPRESEPTMFPSSRSFPAIIEVHKNEAIVEEATEVIVALNDVFESRKALFTITLPGKEPQQFPDAAVGNVWRFERGGKKYRMTLLEVSYIKHRAKLEVRLDPDNI